MSQKSKNSRQKANQGSGSTLELFNELVLDFWHNPSGQLQNLFDSFVEILLKGCGHYRKILLALKQIFFAAKHPFINLIDYNISPETAFEILKNDENSFLIDVRTQQEWLFSGIPDSFISKTGKFTPSRGCFIRRWN